MKTSSRAPALFWLSVAGAAFFNSAHAQAPCSGAPGERIVGATAAGQGIASFPLCVRDTPVDQEAIARREAQRKAEEEAREEAARIEEAAQKKMVDDYVRATKDRANNINKLANDPTFKKMGDGFWFYIEPGKNGALATLPCMAKFVQMRGMVSVVALGGADEPIGGMVEGWDVPKPAKSREIDVGASKNGGAPITIKAMNSYVEGDAFGSLTFVSANNLKDAMTKSWEEQAEVKFEFEGKTIFEGGYGKGSEMKKRFTSCVQQVKK